MEIEEVIDNLIKEKKYTELKEKLKKMKSADISAIIDDLNREDAVIIFRLLSKKKQE